MESHKKRMCAPYLRDLIAQSDKILETQRMQQQPGETEAQKYLKRAQLTGFPGEFKY